MTWRETIKTNRITAIIPYILKYKLFFPIKRELTILEVKIKTFLQIKNLDDRRIECIKENKNGEICFVIGNGPSVKMEILDEIYALGIDSFGANRIMDIFDRTKWRPKYLTVSDPSIMLGSKKTLTAEEYAKKVLDIKEVNYLFLNRTLKKYIAKRFRKKCFFFTNPQANLFSDNIQPFSEDVSVYLSDLGNVTTASIQIAIYMGYKYIYLYGIDNTYIKFLGDDGLFHVREGTRSHIQGMKESYDDIPSNFIPKSKFQAYMQGGFSDVRKMNLGYAKCKAYADNHGIVINNATHGGTLDIFGRTEIEELLRNLKKDNGL